MRNAFVVVVAAGVACGGHDLPQHWSERPLATYTGEVNGIGYSIALPAGMKQSDSSFHIPHGDTHAKSPYITVAVALVPSASIDAWKRIPRTPTYERRVQLGEAALLTQARSSTDFTVDVLVSAGDRVLTCHANVSPWDGMVDVVRENLGLVEQMCLSLKATK